MKGEVVVGKGDMVRHDDVVARTDLPGEVTTVNLVNRLGGMASEVPSLMLKAEGEAVTEGEAIAETRPFFKWFKRSISSPITGAVESVSSITGQVILRRPPRPVEVRAFVDGQVVDVLPSEGVVVEASGAYVQGIFGVGGERWGALRVGVDDPGQSLTADRIGPDDKGRILVGGGRIPLSSIRRAVDVGAVGIIGGGIQDQSLRDLLGYDLGVAITGTEPIGITVIVTEGFGSIRMADKAFSIFKEMEGRDASISGATQIRAGVMRPEVFVKDDTAGSEGEGDSDKGLEEGTLLRAIRAPYFGRIGRVTALPPELRAVESEARVRVLEVMFEDGERAILPRANVERIEE